MKWYKIRFNSQNIILENEKSVLIKMPHKSKFDGWVFWHPSNLISDDGGNGFYKNISYSNDFLFHLKRYGKSNHLLEKKDISAADFEEAFSVFICPDKVKKEVPILSDDFEVIIPDDLKDDDV
jgi:hypothetical protein